MQTTIRPRSEAEVADAITFAVDSGSPLEVIGGATKRAVATPTQTAYTLDMSDLAGIVSYEPEELVLTLSPGTPMAEVAAALAERKQMLAFEPPDYAALLGTTDGTPTFGGAFATNFAGPRRIAAGAVRDHMLGIAAISGRGEKFKAGGRVVKNVTGYDLARALAGSWGTLAVATELTVKVLPAPQRETTVVLIGLSPEDAAAAMARALGSPGDFSGAAHLPADIAADLVPDAGASLTLLRLDGFGPSVAARVAEAERLFAGTPQRLIADDASAALWRAVRDGTPFVGGSGVVWRCSVPPMAGPSLLAAAPAGARAYLDWGGGLVMIETPATGDAGAETLRAAAENCGGHALMLRAPVDIRARVATFHPMAPGIESLSRRLRQAFDPKGVLNPNRMSRESG